MLVAGGSYELREFVCTTFPRESRLRSHDGQVLRWTNRMRVAVAADLVAYVPREAQILPLLRRTRALVLNALLDPGDPAFGLRLRSIPVEALRSLQRAYDRTEVW